MGRPSQYAQGFERTVLFMSVIGRFLVGDGCWNWTGRDSGNGYGMIRIKGKTIMAHRAVWNLMRGDIPDGLVLDHLCRNTHCVRPDHLEPVEHGENIRRGWAAKRAQPGYSSVRYPAVVS